MEQPVTLISGTSKGIGKFLVEHYVSEGHFVVGCSRGNCLAEAKNYAHRICDVGVEGEVLDLFRFIRKTFSRLDNIINNAGIALMNHSLLTPLASVEKVFRTNVFGTFLFCREGAKIMKSRNFGRIVNFSTVAVPLKLEGEATYASSKAAIVSLTEILAREYAEFGVTVNSVSPTPIATDLIRNVPQEKIVKLIERQAIKRFGEFRDVTNAIDFFLRKESDFITGQTLFLGGV
jgi:3-oxoacyl-[acyl-carrier protein] reductase